MFASNTSQVSSDATYIEDVFSTYLYTGNGSTQTINNGIDESGKGALTWIKCRSNAATNNSLFDTTRGANNRLSSNSTAAQASLSDTLTAFTSSGFTLGADTATGGDVNANGYTYASWTFRKQPKFFDVVTFTSNASGGATINHSLGSTPGCVIVKSTAATGNWFVYHRSMDPAEYMFLNTTAAAANGGRTVTTSSTQVTYPNGYFANSTAYVAYLFAHDAGGFGLTGTDNVISCGSFTGASEAASVNLGWEPQWVLVKRTDAAGGWQMADNMRGMYAPTQTGAMLFAQSANAESNPNGNVPFITSTGFLWDGVVNFVATGSPTYIYIAIRRGPMKTPTSGTSVFDTALYTGNATARTVTLSSTMPYTDMGIWRAQSGGTNNFNQGWWTVDRLRGMASTPSSAGVLSLGLLTAFTDAESGGAPYSVINNTADLTASTSLNVNTAPFLVYSFRRAPGFFDVVCYTGTGSVRTVTHNLGVVPELMIVKIRNLPDYDWHVYNATVGATKFLVLNTTAGPVTDSGDWNNTAPTSSVFTVGANSEVNGSGNTYVAHLFASCPGVSKVGSYTGTGTTQQINCGFTGGARFVLIKRTDSTGDWYVWDTARGIVSGNDPYLLLNSTAAEVTSTDYIDTYSAGFEISSTAPAAINASGGTFIYLAIA